MVGQKMSEDWGRPVVIENRVGANTVIGAQAVQKAPADGFYTMLMAIDSTLAMNQTSSIATCPTIPSPISCRSRWLPRR